MSRYDRQYDFGLRGYSQTTRPMMDARHLARSYDAGFRRGFDERAFPEQRLGNREPAHAPGSASNDTPRTASTRP